MTEQQYCQSCGMPLDSDGEMSGTETDGSKSHDYCLYCYNDGQFTADMTMNQMIEHCLTFLPEFDVKMTEEQAREMMEQYFPSLKRWKQ